ncbi:MAG: DNA polymerase III subunit delta' [Rothia sp. (in: high G+C Gram-positive bacteria)]|nr:DNA polymerase III subunit delta' [Rothia sp. (in: high G+C Gram-positive bacteria)]
MTLWQDIVGQPRAVEQLTRAAASPAPAHAWLLTGPPGSGRSSAALAFAAALLCQEQEGGCGNCRSCHTVLKGSHADLTFFSTENMHITIDQARELVVLSQDRPSVGRWRIIIVEDADRMPERTSNVLLKAIEEPPPQTIWLLCAPSPADVLITIRSRCRMVGLQVPPLAEVAALLVRRDKVQPDLARHCASLAQGHVGVARRLALDPQALARREKVVQLPLTVQSVPSAMAAAEQLIDIAEQEAAADAQERNEAERAELLTVLGIQEGQEVNPSLRSQLRQLEDDQKRRARRIKTDTLDRFLIDIQTVFRDVMTLQLNTGSALINSHLEQELKSFAAASTASKTLAHLDTVALTRRRICTNASARLAFEAMLTSLL